MMIQCLEFCQTFSAAAQVRVLNLMTDAVRTLICSSGNKQLYVLSPHVFVVGRKQHLQVRSGQS